MKKVICLNIKGFFTIKNILFASLVLLAILEGLANSPINFEGQFMIDNALVFVIIVLLNKRYSVIVIAVISILTAWVKGFDILALVQTTELIVVWVLHIKHRKSIVMLDLLYWLTIGVPIWMISLYTTGSSLNFQQEVFVLVSILNGIFNALICDIVITYIPWGRIIRQDKSIHNAVSLTTILNHICFASIVIPTTLFFSINSYSVRQEFEKDSIQYLNNASDYMYDKIMNWTDEDKYRAALKNPHQLYKISSIFDLYKIDQNNIISFQLFNQDGNLIMKRNSIEESLTRTKWKIESEVSGKKGLYKLVPNKREFLVRGYNWTNSIFYYERDVNDFKLVVSISAAQYANRVLEPTVDLLQVMIPFSLLIITFAFLINKIFVKSLDKIISITSNLPNKLRGHEEVLFDKSGICEINSLSSNFKDMVEDLNSLICDIESTNKKLQVSQELLIKQANFDFLTDLPNRYYFVKYATAVIDNFQSNDSSNRKSGIAFLLLDLDRFKIVNDTLGHAAGDMLLIKVSRRLQNVIKSLNCIDAFAARLGGDEFVIVLPYDDVVIVHNLARTIKESINESIVLKHSEVNIGVSIGISFYPEDGLSIDDILSKSDLSMYMAKEQGGNHYCVNS